MKSLYLETFGCSRNHADSEIMLGILSKKFIQTKKPENSDLIIINTCTVKKPTESKILNKIRELQKFYKPMIIAGCMPEVQLQALKKIAPEASFVGPHFVKDILKVAELCLKKEKIERVGKRKEALLCAPRLQANKIIGIVPISSGCISSCSYCIVKFARGSLYSYPEKDILKEIEILLGRGTKEIWLTAQDLAAYGFDEGKNLPSLIEKICQLKKKFYIRFGMMHPANVLKILSALIKAYKNEKVFKFLHLPVQSGNNLILKKMSRNYTAEQFEKIIERFRNEIPEITISTDIIVGFPTETEKQFANTCEMIKRIKPDIVNISKFGTRPGTSAEKMPQVSDKIKKQRSKQIAEIIEKIKLEKNKNWLNWSGKVLIDEIGKVQNTFIGRNFAYKPIVLKSRKNLFGKEVFVKISKTGNNYLLGKLHTSDFKSQVITNSQ